MSDSRYEFHQHEIDSLKSAAIYTLAVCANLKRMLEGIRDDQPRFASRGIHELLDPNYQCKSYVDKVDHLLAPVSIPVKVPIRTKMHRGSDGIHYEDMFPLVIEFREEPLAHLAAWLIHDTVVSYLWSVWRRGNPGLVYCDALEATYELVGPRWSEIRQELSGFVEYDCLSLRKAIENESKAAIERCRQTIVDAATHWNRLNVEISLDGGDGTFPEWLAPKLPQVADTVPTKTESKVAKGLNWQDVQAELERMHLQGDPYTSEKKLAEKIGCSKFLVNKAFKNGSAELLEWRTKSHVESRLNVSPEASALAIERTAQSREDDPAEFIEPEVADDVLEYLIDQAGESQRQHLTRLLPDQRQAMAKIMLNDPDKEEQFLRYRKAKRSRRD